MEGWELVVVVLVVVLLFGANRLPKIARSLGEARTEFDKVRRDALGQHEEPDVPVVPEEPVVPVVPEPAGVASPEAPPAAFPAPEVAPLVGTANADRRPLPPPLPPPA